MPSDLFSFSVIILAVYRSICLRGGDASPPLYTVFCPVFGQARCPSGASTLPNKGKHVAPPGHIFFSSSAQNLPFSMTVRIKCPSAFGDRHRSKIESGYHSRNTDLSSRSNNFYIRQKPGYPP